MIYWIQRQSGDVRVEGRERLLRERKGAKFIKRV